MDNKVIRSWKRSDNYETISVSPKKPLKPIGKFLEEFHKYKSPEKIRDVNEAKEMKLKSTEKERKRLDQLNYIKQKKDKKIVIRSSPTRQNVADSSLNVSPPASGYKYTFLSPEKILEEGLRKNDTYMIKNALKKGAGFNTESIPSVNHLIRLDKYKQLSQDELRNLKESIIRHLQVTDLRTIQNDSLNSFLQLLNYVENRIH
jgi:hypothetical protein